MIDKNNRLFVYLHGNEEDQQEFLSKAKENDCFAQPINFMIRQAALDVFTRKTYYEGKEIKYDKNFFWNGTRPYMTISNANPDKIGSYYNWTYLENIIETGWKKQLDIMIKERIY